MLPRAAPHALHALNTQHFMLTPHASDPNSTHSMLEIARQPPESWYKDQFGRKATFEVAVRRVARGCAACADQRHLNVQLLYESGKLVENQNILRVASGLCLNKDDHTTLAIRIMEVSKNHQNQKFRLQISLPPCPLKHLGAGVSGVISEPVLVLSKKNKRPVKSDTDDAPENKSILKLKKSKHLASPNGSIRDGNSPFNTPTSRPKAHIESPPDFDVLGEEDVWGGEIVRFRSPSQGLCLWANAAFNFMHRLQWQDRVDGPQDSDARFKCPSCRAAYGSHPVHRSDCDLALLLEQTGSLEDPQDAEYADKSNHVPPRKSRTDQHDSNGSQPAARPSLVQNSNRNGSTIPKDEGQPPTSGFGSASIDLMAKNLNLASWEGYSSLSKIMFSLEAGIKQPANIESAKQATNDAKSSDVSMNSLMSGAAGWSFGAPSQSGQLSLNLSSLLSSVKGLSPDTAAFLQEQEAELTGDASLLRSLSRVSLSDFLPDGNSDKSEGDGARLAATALGSVLADESRGRVTEDDVVAIACVDFHNCGYPAFDSSNALVGSYFLSEKKPHPELRFLPNLYPLPPQMLQDLEANLTAWRQHPEDVLFTRSDSQTLEQLKAQVVERLRAN